jgi:hypothetical protein
MLSIIWIKRESEIEDRYINEYLDILDTRNIEAMVVGHTNLTRKDFTYVPFYEFGLDSLGLICHKKNLGVAKAKYNLCLVLHADTRPDESFIELIKNGEHLKHDLFTTAICPLGVTESGARGLTWCNYAGMHKHLDEPENAATYISGAAIFGSKNFFLKNPWDQNLRHNMEEDWQYSRMLRDKGFKNVCDPRFKVIMKNTQ